MEVEKERKEPEEKKENELPKNNECALVWEGLVKKSSFKKFRFKQCATELLIIAYLEKHGVAHYWEYAKNYNKDVF